MCVLSNSKKSVERWRDGEDSQGCHHRENEVLNDKNTPDSFWFAIGRAF